MGQRTVAELVKCPLPSRCFTEQRPRPLVGQPPPAVGASIELGRNDVGQTRRLSKKEAESVGGECRGRFRAVELPSRDFVASSRIEYAGYPLDSGDPKM